MAASALSVQPQLAHARTECGSKTAAADESVSNTARGIGEFTVASLDENADMHAHLAPVIGSGGESADEEDVRRGAEGRVATVGEQVRSGKMSGQRDRTRRRARAASPPQVPVAPGAASRRHSARRDRSDPGERGVRSDRVPSDRDRPGRERRDRGCRDRVPYADEATRLRRRRTARLQARR